MRVISKILEYVVYEAWPRIGFKVMTLVRAEVDDRVNEIVDPIFNVVNDTINEIGEQR